MAIQWHTTARIVCYISEMDTLMVAGIAMLVGWAGLTFATEAPGAVHLLLTAGVFLIIWRMVARGTPAGPAGPSSEKSRNAIHAEKNRR